MTTLFSEPLATDIEDTADATNCGPVFEVYDFILRTMVEAVCVVTSRAATATWSARHLVIDAGDKILTLSAASVVDRLEVSTEAVLVTAPGRVALRATKLQRVARFARDKVAVAVVGKRAHIEAQTKWKVAVAEAPEVEDVPQGPKAVDPVDPKALRSALRTVLPAVGNHGGDRFVYLNETWAMASSGGLLLGRQVTMPFPVVLEQCTAKVLERVLRNEPQWLRAGVDLDLEQVRFAVDGTVVTSRLPDAEMRDFDFAIKSVADNKLELHADREQLAGAIRSVLAPIADDTSPNIDLKLTKDQLVVAATDRFQNTGRRVLDVGWKHGSREARFNSKRLLDLVDSTDKPGIVIAFNEPPPGKPTLIKLIAEDRIGVLHSVKKFD